MNYASSKSNGAGVSDGRASATSVESMKNGAGKVVEDDTYSALFVRTSSCRAALAALGEVATAPIC